MLEESILPGEVIEAILSGAILEDYPEHRRGACCLLHGITRLGRHLHIVCTTSLPVMVLITVYEPKPPKWESPAKRSVKS